MFVPVTRTRAKLATWYIGVGVRVAWSHTGTPMSKDSNVFSAASMALVGVIPPRPAIHLPTLNVVLLGFVGSTYSWLFPGAAIDPMSVLGSVTPVQVSHP